MKPFHRLGQLFLSMPSVLPTRLGVFGVSLRCVSQKHKVLLTGDGHSKMTCGRSSGLQTHHCRGVDATKNVVEGANVMALISLAQNCAAVIARCCPDLTLNLWYV